MKKPRVTVNTQDSNGRNQTFHDNQSGRNMNRQQFVKSIEKGNYPNYYVRKINNLETPCSKPDNTKNDNLG